jgi:hypothetical protein
MNPLPRALQVAFQETECIAILVMEKKSVLEYLIRRNPREISIAECNTALPRVP